MTCDVRQAGDSSWCESCGSRWDTNELPGNAPPNCGYPDAPDSEFVTGACPECGGSGDHPGGPPGNGACYICKGEGFIYFLREDAERCERHNAAARVLRGALILAVALLVLAVAVTLARAAPSACNGPGRYSAMAQGADCSTPPATATCDDVRRDVARYRRLHMSDKAIEKIARAKGASDEQIAWGRSCLLGG